MENTKVLLEELNHLYDVKEIFEMVKRFNLDEFYQNFELVEKCDLYKSIQADLKLVPNYAWKISSLLYQLEDVVGSEGPFVKSGCLEYTPVCDACGYKLRDRLRELLIEHDLCDIESEMNACGE